MGEKTGVTVTKSGLNVDITTIFEVTVSRKYCYLLLPPLPGGIKMNRIKQLRQERGLTLDDIENQTRIKRGTFNNYERSK